MATKNFYDCTTDKVCSIVYNYFCAALNRCSGYCDFNIRVDSNSVTAWDGYDSVTISKCNLPNKIARKLYL